MPTVTKPDFICIGPTKTGTTWLYEMLHRHPQVWLPPLKELSFLSEGHGVPAHSLWNVLFSKHWFYARMRRRLLSHVRSMLGSGEIAYARYADPWWFYRYCFGRRSFEWYSELFLPDPSRLGGDISPLYADIPEHRIRDASAFNPTIKILAFIRNPIERVWSLALMALCRDRGRQPADVPRAEFTDFFDGVHESRRPYAESIELWRRYFPAVFVGYYDALKADPRGFFRDVCRFLDIDDAAVESSLLAQYVNRGLDEPLPRAFAEYLRAQYADEITALAGSDASGYPRGWLAQW